MPNKAGAQWEWRQLPSPLVWIILMTLPTYSYKMTRLHWAMSMPSSATEVAIRMLLSPLALNASSAHFCAGSVIPALDKEVTVQLTRERVTLLENQPLIRNHLKVESYFYLEKQTKKKHTVHQMSQNNETWYTFYTHTILNLLHYS